MRERLAAADLEVSFTRAEAIDPAAVVTPTGAREDDLARLWIDLRGEQDVTLYLVDGAWERVLVRRFARRDNPEVLREELGHVIELAIVALRAGERIGVGRDEARAELAPAPPPPSPAAVVPPPEAPPAPPPSPAPRAPAASTRLHAGAFYETQAYAGGLELSSGPGIFGEVRARPGTGRLSYGGLVSVQYRLPSQGGDGETTMRFEGGALQLLAVGALAVSKPAELSLALGPGLELLDAEAQGARASEVRLAEGKTRVLPSVRALVRYEHAIPSLRLFAGLGIDVPFQSTRYLVARPTEAVVFFEAWAVRPFLLAGIETP